MKKIISVLMCVCVLLSAFTVTSGFSAAAETKNQSLSDGLWSLRSQFRFGVGPSSNGVISMDYEYYSPIKENDSTKYPVVVWLHGLFTGTLPGQQITHNDIAYWSSREFQARFTPAGGAFILAPRSMELVDVWDESCIDALKRTIDYFVSKYSANIDTTRIYLGGLSTGGKMVCQLAAAYPEMFAAIFPCSPTYTITSSDSERLKNTPVWLLCSSTDVYVSYLAVTKPSWNRLMAASNCAADCRIATFSIMLYPDGRLVDYSHDTWYACTYDMFTEKNQPYYNMNIVDGYGDKVTLTYPHGMISWLCQFTSNYYPEGSGSDGIASNIFRFVIGVFLAFVSYFVIKLRIL